MNYFPLDEVELEGQDAPAAKPGLWDKAKAAAGSARTAVKNHVAKPLADGARKAEFAVTGKPSALRNTGSGDEQQISLTKANMFYENEARGGDLAESLEQAKPSTVGSLVDMATPRFVSAAQESSQLSTFKSQAEADGLLPEGSDERNVVNHIKGNTKASGVLSATTGLGKKVVGAGIDAGGAALAPFTGGLSSAAGKVVKTAVNKGIDKLSGAVMDAHSDSHGVSTEDTADVLSGPLGGDLVRAQHTRTAEGDFHADLADVSPLEAAKLSESTSKGRKAESMKEMDKAAAYGKKAAAEDSEAAHQATLSLFDPLAH